MSAQLTLKDIEMQALLKCITKAADSLLNDPDFLTPDERDAAGNAYAKIHPLLNRRSRRRPKT